MDKRSILPWYFNFSYILCSYSICVSAGWSSGILRVPLAIGRWLLPGSVLMLIVFAITNHDVFHWTHEYLYDKSDPDTLCY